MPQGKEEYPNFGTVVSVGREVMCVKRDDRVIFQRKPSSAISPEARSSDEYWGLLVLPDDFILAIVEGD